MNRYKEKVSIIIPTYNNDKYLGRCINSIINQTYSNLEIIVINDGSTDNTLSIIKEFQQKDNRIKLIDKKNEGVSIARNSGIQIATGEYINFVDGDDWLEENAIEELYKKIKEEDVDVVRGSYYRNYAEDDFSITENDLVNFENKKILKNSKDMSELIREFYSERIPCYVWLLLIKREIIDNKIVFKEEISMMEDTIFYIELLYNCNSIFISTQKNYHYFCNNDSAVKSYKNLQRNIYDRIKVNKCLKQILAENNENFDDEKILNTMCAKIVLIYLFRISFLNNKELKNTYKDLQNNIDFKKIINNIDVLDLSLQDKIQIKLFKTNRFGLLKIYFKIRKVMKSLKDTALKRKE